MHEEQVVKRYLFCLSILVGVETGLVRHKRGWGSVLCKYFKLNICKHTAFHYNIIRNTTFNNVPVGCVTPLLTMFCVNVTPLPSMFWLCAQRSFQLCFG